MMTVRELIGRLEELDQDAIVVQEMDGEYYSSPTVVQPSKMKRVGDNTFTEPLGMSYLSASLVDTVELF